MHQHTAMSLAVLAVPLPAAAQAPAQFTVRTPAPVAAAMLVEAAAADFDGDGDLDLCGGAFLFSPFRQVLLRNDGMERFTNVTATNLPMVASVTLCTLAFDMDGDGDLDLFVGKQNTPSCLWRNTGGGIFVDASANLPATAANVVRAIAFDFDGDGDLDIAAVSHALIGGTPHVLMNNGSGVFTEVGSPFYSGIAVVALDLDRDGDLDLAINDLTTAGVYRNDGNMAFTDVTAQWLGTWAVGGQALAAGDLDGDGDADLVMARRFQPDVVLLNTGTTFAVSALLPMLGGNTMSLALVDFDQDGDLDLIRSGISSQLVMETNDGTGTFTSAPARLPAMPSNAGFLTVGDFDRDGDRDLLLSAPFVPVVMLVNQHRDLLPGTAQLGQTWTIELFSAPGYAIGPQPGLLGIGLARLPQPLALPVFGELWLDLAMSHLLVTGLVPPAAGRLPFSFSVPSLPQLHGVELHLQGMLDQSPLRLTAYRSLFLQ